MHVQLEASGKSVPIMHPAAQMTSLQDIDTLVFAAAEKEDDRAPMLGQKRCRVELPRPIYIPGPRHR